MVYRGVVAAAVCVAGATVGLGGNVASASVPRKANPKKVCAAVARLPRTPKAELAAIRLAQSGKNPDMTQTLAAMEQAAQEAVTTKSRTPLETEEYDANLQKVFDFAYESCVDTQAQLTFDDSGLGGVPFDVDAGTLGFTLSNESSGNIGFGVVHVKPSNKKSTADIITELYASDDGTAKGTEFVGGGSADVGGSDTAVAVMKPGRNILLVFPNTGVPSSQPLASAEITAG